MGKISITIESEQLDDKALEQLATSMIPSSLDWKEGCYQLTGAKIATLTITYPNQIDNNEPIVDEYEPSEEELNQEEQLSQKELDAEMDSEEDIDIK